MGLELCRCIRYCSWITNYPKTQQLKTTNFIASQFLWVKNLCGLCGVPLGQGLSQAITQGCSYLKTWLREDVFPNSCTQLLTGFSPHWLLARDIGSLPGGPLIESSQQNSLPLEHVSERERAARERPKSGLRWKRLSFYNLMFEGTSHCFCHILYVRSKSVSAGEGITQVDGHWEAGITGSHLDGCPTAGGKYQSYIQKYLEVKWHDIWIFFNIHTHTK